MLEPALAAQPVSPPLQPAMVQVVLMAAHPVLRAVLACCHLVAQVSKQRFGGISPAVVGLLGQQETENTHLKRPFEYTNAQA